MLSFHHCPERPKISPSHPLADKRVYIPIMAEGASEAFASCFRWLGIDAEVTPASGAHTRGLGRRFTCGDECYPANFISSSTTALAHALTELKGNFFDCRFNVYGVRVALT